MKFINKNTFIILFIPSILVIATLFLTLATGPFWQFADCCYVYLFNALHFLKGIAPTHIDHPGTPLQLLILLTISSLNMGSSITAIVDKVLINPEYYLHVVHILLIFSIFITSALLALYVFHKTQDIRAALLTQLPGLSFLLTKSFESNWPVPPIMANVIPETLLVTILNLFNLFLLILFFAKTIREELLASLLLGFICGLGLSIKLTFVPVILSVLILLSWRMKIFFMITCLISFFLWTLPIIHLYPALWEWTKGITTHTGTYGFGNQGIIDWPIFIKNFLKDILPGYWPFLALSICTFAWSTIKIIQRQQNRYHQFLWALNIGFLIQLVIVAKHYSAHYLVPGIGLFSSILALFYLAQLSTTKPLRQLTLIFIILCTMLISAQAFMYSSKLASFTKELSKLKNDIYTHYPGCLVIASADTNPFFSQNFALHFANRYYSRFLSNKSYSHKESEKLSSLYPQSFYFNFDATSTSGDNPGYGMCDFQKRIYMDDLLTSYPYVIFVNYKLDFYLHNGFDFSEHPFTAQLLESSKYADLYLITSSTDKQSSELLTLSLELTKQQKYPEAFALALKSRELNYQPKGQVEYYLSIMYNYLHRN